MTRTSRRARQGRGENIRRGIRRMKEWQEERMGKRGTQAPWG